MARNTPITAPSVVFAVATAGCGADGMTLQIREGDTWAADDPIVLANPGLFSSEPTRINRSI